MTSLSRRGMRSPRNIQPPPEFIAQVSQLIKVNTRTQNAALVRAITRANRGIVKQLEKIMHSLEDLLTAVAGQRTQIDSLVTLTTGLHKQVLEAMGGALTPSQQDRIDRIFAAINDNADAVSAAIKENTVEASAGAVSGGPNMRDIKDSGLSGSVGQQTIVASGVPDGERNPNVPDSDGQPNTGGTPIGSSA